MEKKETNELSFGSNVNAEVKPTATTPKVNTPPAPEPKVEKPKADKYAQRLFSEGLLEGDINDPESWKRNTRCKSVPQETIESQSSVEVRPYVLKAFGYYPNKKD